MERMMTAVPRFRPRGSGLRVQPDFEYTVEMCDCRLCLYYNRKRKCTVSQCPCPCIEERIAAGAARRAEVMTETMKDIHNAAFCRRLNQFIRESEEPHREGSHQSDLQPRPLHALQGCQQLWEDRQRVCDEYGRRRSRSRRGRSEIRRHRQRSYRPRTGADHRKRSAHLQSIRRADRSIRRSDLPRILLRKLPSTSPTLESISPRNTTDSL